MTFDEWWELDCDRTWKATLLPDEADIPRRPAWGSAFRPHAEKAWRAAIEAERAACAQLCRMEKERLGMHMHDGHDAAFHGAMVEAEVLEHAITNRSNSEVTR